MAEPSHKEFAHRWVGDVIRSMGEHLDLETRIKVLESCGRACARIGPAKVAQKCQGNLEAWLGVLRQWHGSDELVQQEGDVVTVRCDRCLCTLVQDGPEKLPGTFCYCSLGWMKEVFGTVMGKPVEVELASSIKRGGDECRFIVKL